VVNGSTRRSMVMVISPKPDEGDRQRHPAWGESWSYDSLHPWNDVVS
jgi:hypothetical protein